MGGDAGPGETKPLWREVFLAILTGSLAATLVGYFTHRDKTQTEEQVKAIYAKLNAVSTSQRNWEEKSVAELLGPMVLQFDRTKRAFGVYVQSGNDKGNRYLEANIIKVGNETVRDLLVSKTHLIPIDLLPDAGKLVEHYDRWLQKFEEQRGGQAFKPGDKFVFVGPDGFPFPTEAEKRFCERYYVMWKTLYLQSTEINGKGGDARP